MQKHELVILPLTIEDGRNIWSIATYIDHNLFPPKLVMEECDKVFE